MSATASTAPEPAASVPLFTPWVLLATVCSVLMWLSPGNETIPYHVAWAGFALAYGFDTWSPTRTVLALGSYTLITGGLLVTRAAHDVVAWQELAEIPLMLLLMVLMVWHVRRRQAALATATALARQERERAANRERLTRLTSHEMRTPLTIAQGFVELLQERETDAGRLADLAVVDDELGRLTRVCERLVRVMRVQSAPRLETVDLDRLLERTAHRWSSVASRSWVVEADGGSVAGSAEALRTGLDTLIENALRYTVQGDTVRLVADRRAGSVCIGVADSGVGMTDERLALVNGSDGPMPAVAPRDSLSQTGLGLELVRRVVAARGGRLRASRAPEGGSLVVMQMPVDPPEHLFVNDPLLAPEPTRARRQRRAARALSGGLRHHRLSRSRHLLSRRGKPPSAL